MSPQASRAPKFICEARPGGATNTRSASEATNRVRSVLPPSTTRISPSKSRRNAAKVTGKATSSFQVGMIIEGRMRESYGLDWHGAVGKGKIAVSEPWYQDGLEFTCTRCGKCCTGEPGFVSV